jgi:transposase
MFIIKTQSSSKGATKYYTHRLVESKRDSVGKVYKQTILNLGSNYAVVEEADWSILTDRIQNILIGQGSLLSIDKYIESEAQRIASIIIKRDGKALDSNKELESNYQHVDVATLRNSDVKTVGAEHLAFETAKKLNIPEILADCGLSKRDVNSSFASIIGRLLSPGSEVSTSQYLKNNSALDEVIGTDFTQMHKERLYKISDILLKHKNVIEDKLYNEEKSLFALKEIVTLYDLTNTYFEGESRANENAAFGRSKEKRTDCPLVTLALVLDGSGFPKKTHIFKGNISEATTLESMLNTLGSKEAIVVMDAGIATEDNIEWLNDNNYKYLVISRKRKQELPEIEGVIVKNEPNNKVTTFLLKNEKESELYCHSEGMARRTTIMSEKYIKRFTKELQKLSDGLTKKGSIKKYDRINQKIGRLREKYSKVALQFNITVIADDKKEKVTQLTWEHQPDKQSKEPGIYCIRTNQTELNNKEIWDTYRMLNDVEAAFRTLKTDLGLRPIYHQKTDRISGHIFISVLAYHILHTIRYQLLANNITDSWQTIQSKLSTHYRVTTTLKQKDNKTLHIRKSMQANPQQKAIYQACNIISAKPNTIITSY